MSIEQLLLIIAPIVPGILLKGVIKRFVIWAVAESLPSFRQWGNWGVEQLVYLASRGRR